MTDTSMKGKVQTVTGVVEPGDLGPTTTHEHLLIDFSIMFHEPEEATEKFKAHQPVTMENLGWIRYHTFANLDSLMMIDEQEATAEAMLYMRAGGGTIVEGHHHRHRARPAGPRPDRPRHWPQHHHGRWVLCRRRPSRRHGRPD